MQVLLESILVLLLGATLFHAIRLERALGVLKRDRRALEELIEGFNASTRQAEQGIERLRGAADGTGRQIARHLESGGALKDDLGFLLQRGEQLADRLDLAVRAARTHLPEPPRPELLRPEPSRPEPPRTPPRRPALEPALLDAREPPRVRSEAERELLRALRLAR